MVRSQGLLPMHMTIGQLAASADVNVQTVRYYQRRGLLPTPVRPEGGVRRYGAEETARLGFIRRAQATGFSLAEVAQLLAANGHGACAHTLALTEARLVDVRSRLAALQALERDLSALVMECRQAPAGTCGPTLDRLGENTEACALPTQRRSAVPSASSRP